jgi:hypothetical protein
MNPALTVDDSTSYSCGESEANHEDKLPTSEGETGALGI